ncbi:MAG TPA: DSD1 family PLP-dependent enzyme [Pseudolabrys sp.]|nr:DSD1 family PLP-dependent enzyme [Pseudolabrys sp.]
MSLPPPSTIGAPFTEIDTPALIIDLDAFERNLDTMAAAAQSLGVRLRPHAKTHKSPIIAAKQIARGAVGMCCQKVGEAEVLVEGGVADVLVSNEVVGERKLARLAALARHARIGICVDDAGVVAQLANAAEHAGAQIEVLVEIDVGGRRCGVAPGAAAVDLARRVAASPALSFGGLQAYHGSAQHLRTPAERRAAIAAAQAATAETMRHLSAAGFSCRTVGGAGTGTFSLEGASGVWNELQAGSYIFMDADYAKNAPDDGRNAHPFEHALFILATVMSRSAQTRAVIDVGHKATANDSGFPLVWGHSEATYHRPSDEHGILDLSASNWRPALGEKILLVPGHCDPTVNLYDWYVGVRGFGTSEVRVEALWPIAARGAIT